ncbi:hypothetical protein TPB0596_08980 [Tsukamurella pulmonis]|uniref:Secreted protein n=1 Tax=Tsukamurella pulmonis TaxID=47312 RepID=A0A1H1H949_9ACTN|nr:hypothetical protein [Tsukamurella pulmonis]KXO94932.1 hypothetical protein AXK56_20295 [Tsukamurella pulmonis]KXP12955.1 hypothetical protein AXK57_01555 [Tsukamurella pulmonis]RDH13550.1 hypothetical protein DVB88_01910 [Tsukamurella pulmonis]SDR21974.1 hypothetical protein SAMN04489765_3933 [Tsukamurella pulmonis]SUP15558.1 Uncharacterised protein [Tsukamurella pulmonis]
MRTFITTATIASAAGAALILAAAPAHADPDIDDYARGSIGESCAGYPVGKLALERNQGFVLSCNSDGTWHIPTAP